MFNPLKNYQILIVDADAEMARVLKIMLGEMGFVNVHVTQSGKEAINLLRDSKFDFVITEWNTQNIDGLALLDFLRHSPNSPNMTMPTIMLTGRAEQEDVLLARDHGINEYMVKPFTARSIYSRLERIIEQPRNFVASEHYVGLCRRTKNMKLPEGIRDRRKANVLPKLQPVNVEEVNKEVINSSFEPKLWLPDFSLKQKLGKDVKLNDFVTPEILIHAQSSIDSITRDSLQWIRDNLREIKQLYEVMLSPSPSATIAADIGNVALVISSRAGTFGYSRASEIAYGLYVFTRNKLDPTNKNHNIIVQKHIEVLHVILGNQMRGSAGAVGAQISAELKTLVVKYS